MPHPLTLPLTALPCHPSCHLCLPCLPARACAVYTGDTSAHVVRRKHLLTGHWEVLAGREGHPGFHNGPGSQALLNAPSGLCQLPGGFLVVADRANACLRRINLSTGRVSTLAGACGQRPGFADGAAEEARFSDTIGSVTCLANCSVIVGDVANGRLR